MTPPALMRVALADDPADGSADDGGGAMSGAGGGDDGGGAMAGAGGTGGYSGTPGYSGGGHNSVSAPALTPPSDPQAGAAPAVCEPPACIPPASHTHSPVAHSASAPGAGVPVPADVAELALLPGMDPALLTMNPDGSFVYHGTTPVGVETPFWTVIATTEGLDMIRGPIVPRVPQDRSQPNPATGAGYNAGQQGGLACLRGHASWCPSGGATTLAPAGTTGAPGQPPAGTPGNPVGTVTGTLPPGPSGYGPVPVGTQPPDVVGYQPNPNIPPQIYDYGHPTPKPPKYPWPDPMQQTPLRPPYQAPPLPPTAVPPQVPPQQGPPQPPMAPEPPLAPPLVPPLPQMVTPMVVPPQPDMVTPMVVPPDYTGPTPIAVPPNPPQGAVPPQPMIEPPLPAMVTPPDPDLCVRTNPNQVLPASCGGGGVTPLGSVPGGGVTPLGSVPGGGGVVPPSAGMPGVGGPPLLGPDGNPIIGPDGQPLTAPIDPSLPGYPAQQGAPVPGSTQAVPGATSMPGATSPDEQYPVQAPTGLVAVGWP